MVGSDRRVREERLAMGDPDAGSKLASEARQPSAERLVVGVEEHKEVTRCHVCRGISSHPRRPGSTS